MLVAAGVVAEVVLLGGDTVGGRGRVRMLWSVAVVLAIGGTVGLLVEHAQADSRRAVEWGRASEFNRAQLLPPSLALAVQALLRAIADDDPTTFTGISQACVDAAAEHQRPVTVLPDGGTPRVPGRARPAPGSEQMRSAESGIGAIIAAALLTAGAHVTVVSRRPVEGDVVEELDGCGDWESIIGDLSTDAGRAHVTDAVLAVYDRLHVLVNNAGTTWGAPLADYPSAAFDKVLAVNLTAVFDLTRRLLPALTRAAKPDDPARVINIGSVDGIRVPPMQSYAYSSSKAQTSGSRLAPVVKVDHDGMSW